MKAVSILVWNVWWAKPSTTRGRELKQRVESRNPDVAIFTEVTLPFLDKLGGHTVTSEADYGYPLMDGRRKVALWSRHPWTQVDSLGSKALPSGRYVGGSTTTPVGDVRILGVCIPWREAHVRSGRKDRALWQDHLAFIEGLAEILPSAKHATILGGDFNQRIPRHGQPQHVSQALSESIQNLSCVTTGKIPPLNRKSIDHVAVTSDFQAGSIEGISNYDGDSRLSDHIGICCELTRNGRSDG